MTQNAQVIAVFENGTANVRIERMSACGHDCSSCEGCGMMAAPIEVTAQNPLRAMPGDTVVIESGSKRVLTLAFLTYLLPVLLLFSFFSVARLISLSESLCSLLGVLGFLLGLSGAVYSNRKGQIQTEIIEILQKGTPTCSDM